MDSHSKTMAAFFLALLFILGSWPGFVQVQATRLLSKSVVSTSSNSQSLRRYHRESKFPKKI